MFLSVFRRKNWNKNVGALDELAISDDHTFSHFDNTFPHVKIFSQAFALESGGASIPQISQAFGQSPGSKCTAVYIHAFEGDLEKAVSVFDRKAI